jgi:hypothetical protein
VDYVIKFVNLIVQDFNVLVFLIEHGYQQLHMILLMTWRHLLTYHAILIIVKHAITLHMSSLQETAT